MQSNDEKDIKRKSIEESMEELVNIERLKLLYMAGCITAYELKEELFTESEKEKFESRMKSKLGI